MASAPKDEEVRSVIRSILVSNPNEMSAFLLDRDFREMEGYSIPYSRFGYKSLLDYLYSIPDTVTVKGSVVLPVTTEKAAHVEKMVLKQKSSTSHRRQPPRRSRNHVSAKRRTKKSGVGTHVQNNIDASTLLASSIEVNNIDTKINNSNKPRPRVNVSFFKRHVWSVKRRNDSTHKNAVSCMQPPQSGKGFPLEVSDPGNPFMNSSSKIHTKFHREQINSFESKIDRASHEINKSTSQPSRSETNGLKEAAKQENGENHQNHPAANNWSQNSAKKKKNNMYIIKKRQQAALRRLSNMMDDSSSFSLTVATRLRQLSQHQRHFAEILINRVLHHGSRGNLSSATNLSDSYHYSQQYISYYNPYY